MSLFPSLDQIAAVLAIGGFLFSIFKRLFRKRSVGRFTSAQREVRRLHALFRMVRIAREDALERDIALATAMTLEIRGGVFLSAGLGVLGLAMLSCAILSFQFVAPVGRLLGMIVTFMLLAGGHLMSEIADEIQTRANDIRLAIAGTNVTLEVIHERLARLEYRHPRLAREVQAVRTLTERARRPTGIAWAWDGTEPDPSAQGSVRLGAASGSGYEMTSSNSMPV